MLNIKCVYVFCSTKQLQKLRDVVTVNFSMFHAIERPGSKTLYNEEPLFRGDDDPDSDYVLTMDNAKKILAIHQRLR